MNESACHFSGEKYMVVGILHSCSAGVSFIASIIVICIIILFKKLKFSSQRLVFYLSLAVALYSIATASVKTDYHVINHQTDEFCKWIAFASQYTQWCLLLAVCVITIDILFRILKTDYPNLRNGYTEFFYVILIFVVPGFFNWIPFYWDLYGISGAWCWIKDKGMSSSGTCDKQNKMALGFEFGLWYGPLFVLCCIISIIYPMIVYLLRKQRKNLSIYNPEQIQLLRTMRNEIYSIFWYPIVFMLINIFPLTNRIVSSFTEPVFVLWVLHAVISPLQGGFMALIYTLDPETRRILTLSNIRAAILGFCNCGNEHPVVEYHAVVAGRERGERTRLIIESSKGSESYGST